LCIGNLVVVAAFSGPLLMIVLFPTGWSFAQSRLAWAWVAIVSLVAVVVAIVFGVVNRLSWRVLPNAQIFELYDR
jgi:hypothetical protein